MRFRPLLLLLLAAVPLAHATTVVPPSFPELVAKADAIYRGRVTSVEARRVDRADGGGQVIKTFVTFTVERVLKGGERAEVVLEFLGGTVGDETLSVSGMPTFAVGQREIVFVRRNGVQFCPLVAMMHGRYHVKHDNAAGRDFVARDDGAPLTDVSDVQQPMHEAAPPARSTAAAPAVTNALTPGAFETSIVSEVQRPTPHARLN